MSVEENLRLMKTLDDAWNAQDWDTFSSLMQLVRDMSHLEELDKALEYFEKALVIFKEMEGRIEIAKTLMNIGDIFVLKGEKKRALDYYLEAQSLTRGSPTFEEVTKRLKILKDTVNQA